MTDELYYTSRGSGQPVLCLHDLWSSGSSFGAVDVSDELFNLCAWDAPGYGQSPPPADNADLAWYADQAANLIQRLGSSPAHLVGSGWGALVAMKTATNNPQLVKSLVLSGANVGLARDPDSADELRTHVREFAAAPELNPEGRTAAMNTIVNTYIAPELKTLRVPTLIMRGEHDQISSLEHSTAVAEPIADSVVVTCKDAGHLIHEDRPEAFSIWLDSFLRIVDNIRDDSWAA